MDALHDRVGLEDEREPSPRAHHGAVVAGAAQDARSSRARAVEPEGREERVDEIELGSTHGRACSTYWTLRIGIAIKGDDSSGVPGGSMGRTMVNMEPLPGSLRTETWPPCAST